MERSGPADGAPAVDAQERRAETEAQGSGGGAGEDVEIEDEALEEDLAIFPEDGGIEGFGEGPGQGGAY